MPPRKRQKKCPASASTSISDQNASLGEARAANSVTPFLRLPVEILSEILSYYPLPDFVSLATPTWPQPPEWQRPSSSVLPAMFLERSNTLWALSMTSSALRSRTLPLLWKRLDACAVLTDETGWYKTIAQLLCRKSQALLDNPHLATYVQVVNVCLTRYQPETVLQPFARCLVTLPNLHTIHIYHAHCKMTTKINAAFEGVCLPSVCTVVLPTSAHEILRCCPNARHVRLTEGDGSQLISAVAKVCKSTEFLDNFPAEEPLLKRIPKAAPNLRRISMRVFHSKPPPIHHLSKCQKLSIIEILFIPHSSPEVEELLKKVVDAAKAVIAGHTDVDGPRIVRVFEDRIDSFNGRLQSFCAEYTWSSSGWTTTCTSPLSY